MVAREGSAPSIPGCRPGVILFHHRAKLAAGDGLAPPRSPSKGDVLLLDDPARKWWPARVTLPVLRFKRPLHHFNACRPNWCSRQDLHLHWRRSRRRASALGYASKMKMEPPAGVAPAGFLYKRNLQAAAWRQNWSQSPVLPWTELAYETCLSAGSTAFGLCKWSPHPELHQAGLLTEQPHR